MPTGEVTLRDAPAEDIGDFHAIAEVMNLSRLLRDAQVLPIWEGTTNILVLDALRVAKKERSHEILGGDALPDERDPKRWMFQLARDYEARRLREIGEDAAADRLARSRVMFA